MALLEGHSASITDRIYNVLTVRLNYEDLVNIQDKVNKNSIGGSELCVKSQLIRFQIVPGEGN